MLILTQAQHARVLAHEREVRIAQEDYQRFRAAYLHSARTFPPNEVELAMIGADMDRANARLQILIGLPAVPYSSPPSKALRRRS